MVTLIKDMNYADEQYNKIFKVLPKDLISKDQIKQDMSQQAPSRNNTLLNSGKSSQQSSKKKLASNHFNS